MKELERPLGRHGNELAGALVFCAIVVFGLALLQSGRLRDWFDPGATIQVLLPAEGLLGLTEGAQVDILGTPAGQVESIVIDDLQSLHARVSIRSEMTEFVRKDSLAIIRKRFGVAGASYLDITRGVGQRLDWEYAVLEATADLAPTDLMAELVAELRDKVLPTLDSAQAAVFSLAEIAELVRDPDGDFRATLSSLRQLSGAVERGDGPVGQLLGDSTLVSDLESLLRESQSGVVELTQLVAGARGQIDPALVDLRRGAASVATMADRLGEGRGSLPEVTQRAEAVLTALQTVLMDLSEATPQLPGITRDLERTSGSLPAVLQQAQSTTAELEQVLRQLRSSWLLGGSPPAPAPEQGRRLSPSEISP